MTDLKTYDTGDVVHPSCGVLGVMVNNLAAELSSIGLNYDTAREIIERHLDTDKLQSEMALAHMNFIERRSRAAPVIRFVPVAKRENMWMVVASIPETAIDKFRESLGDDDYKQAMVKDIMAGDVAFSLEDCLDECGRKFVRDVKELMKKYETECGGDGA